MNHFYYAVTDYEVSLGPNETLGRLLAASQDAAAAALRLTRAGERVTQRDRRDARRTLASPTLRGC